MRITRIVVAALLAVLCANAGTSSITLASSQNPSAFGQLVTLTATVTATSGNVTFYDSANILGIAPVVNGQASLTTGLLPAGARSLTSYYAGASSAVLTQLVGEAPIPANGFRTAGTYNISGFSNQLAVADFNGDGLADLAVPGYTAGTVLILLGEGIGSFLPPVGYPIGATAVAVVAGDFNGDGKPDLAVANGASTVSVLLGNGDGTFQRARNFTVSNTPQFLAVGDFNGDGNLDIVSANTSGLSVLLGNGDGTFQPAVSYPTGSQPAGVVVADFNGDGIADLAVAVPAPAGPGHANSNVAVMLGIGNGFFQPAVNYTVGASPLAIVAGDFNGDGKADIAVAQFGDGNVGVLLGNGDGTFQPSVSYVAGSGPRTLAVLDFNADGISDLVTNNCVLLGNGDGTFQPPLNFPIPSGALQSIAVGDFNGDGRIDLALDGSTLIVLLGESLPPSTTTLEVPASTAYYNQLLTLTATVSPPSATGTVSFFDGPILLGTVSLSNGQAVINGQLQSIGTNLLRAVYNGDAADAVSTSPLVPVTVDMAPTITLLSTSANPVPAGAKLTLTVTMTPSAAPGVVAFYQGATLLGSATLAKGQAAVSVQLSAPGTFSLTAFYGGDQVHYLPSMSNTVTQVVTGAIPPTSVTLTSSAIPSALGQPVILTAAVSSATATGTVTFYDGTTILGDAPLTNGQAALTASLLASGTRSLHAYYAGDANDAPGASAILSQTVSAGPANKFQLTQSYAGGANPAAIVVADFNGDGHADIAIANLNGNTLSVFLGRGDGTFQTALSSLTGEALYSITVGDFNGDGIPDLVVVGTSGVYTLLGNGDGTFQQPIYASSATSTIPAVAGDFNRDGKADLAITFAATVVVLLGNGDGTFQLGVAYSLSGPANALAVGDFNGDGYADIAVSSNFGVAVLFGLGNGTFQPLRGVASVSTNNNSIAVGDFNNDGNLDILTQTGTGFSVALGKGDGTFQNAVTSAASIIVARPFIVGDFNGDGKLDVAGVDYFGFSVQLGNGDGTFQVGVTYASAGSSLLATGEFNGDGKADVAVAGYSSLNIFLGSLATATTTTLMPSSNPSNFGQSVTLTATVTPASASGNVAFYDGIILLGTAILNNGQAQLTTLALPSGARLLKAAYTGDAADLGSTSSVLPQMVGAAPTPSNGFQSPVNLSAGLEPLSVAVGDFNGDGKADVAVANFGGVDGGSSVSVLLGNGDGAFQPIVDYPAGNGASAVAIGDINGDGEADLVVANYYDNTVSVLLGNGDGTFQSAISVAAEGSPISVAIGDFNRDGHPDLAVANFSRTAGAVSVLLGNGDGTFQPAVSYPAGSGAFCVAAGDLYGTGVLDLAVGGYFGVTILQGNGDGTFASAAGVSGGVTYSIALGDFNGDGIMDMATTSYNSGSIGVFLGTRSAAFQTAPGFGYSTGAYPRSLIAGDFNGDGRLDLAVANFGLPAGGSLSVLSGNGDGTFQAPVNYLWAGNPTALAAADFNGDGQLDFVASSQNNSIGVLLGGLRPTSTVTLTSSVNPAKVAQPVVLTAAISPSDATGLVTFFDGTTSLGANSIANGHATLTARFTAAAPHSLTARYAGSGIYTASTSPAVVQIVSGALAATVTSLSSSPNPSQYGQLVTLKAAVNQTKATGIVVFYDGVNILGSSPVVNQSASLSTASLASGSQSLSAYYTGDADYAASSSAIVSQVVNSVPSSGFQSPTTYTTGKNPLAVAAGDFNGDGKVDLAVANSGDNTVSILLGNGDGTFQPAVTYGAGIYPYSIAVGDFNGDGAADLVVANNGGNNVSVLLGNGDGTFRQPMNSAAGNGPYSLAIGDFNHDGNLDLAVTNLLDNTLSILFGHGDGTFQAPVNYLAGNHPDSMAITGTGILIADQLGGQVESLNGVGNGAFQLSNIFGIGSATGPTSIVAGNFGFAVSSYGGRVVVVQSKVVTTYSAGLNPWYLALGDIDGDGQPDLVVANEGGNNVSVLLQDSTGNGTFKPSVNYSTGNGPVAVVIADFNGDGRADLAVVNNLDNSVSVLLGSPAQ